MADRHYDADYQEVGIASILRPKDSRYERFLVVDMNSNEVIAKNVRTGEIQRINPQLFIVTNA